MMDNTPIVQYIAAIGFHHIRGYEVDFIYPKTTKETEWYSKLATIAMPDGVHKLESDIFYFILPKDDEKSGIFYGIGCFGQIPAEELLEKSGDIIRNTVQKTIVLLCDQPYFHSAGALLSSITDSYFDRKDFANNNLLIEAYSQFNEHFKLVVEDRTKRDPDNVSYGSIALLIHEELSISEVLLQFEHDLLVLFKLLLLQKKIVFLLEPTSRVTKTILTLVSLFPGLLTSEGLHQITNHVYEKEDSSNNNLDCSTNEELDSKELASLDSETTASIPSADINTQDENENHEVQEVQRSGDEVKPEDNLKMKQSSSWLDNLKQQSGQAIRVAMTMTSGTYDRTDSNHTTSSTSSNDGTKHASNFTMVPPFLVANSGTRVPDTDKFTCVNTKIDQWGLPLALFDQNNLLLPYADLSFMSILTNKNIHSFLVGVNNQLWPMKADKFHVLVRQNNKSNTYLSFTKSPNKTEINQQVSSSPSSPSSSASTASLLSRTVQLTVADRRFIDYLLQVVKKWNQQHNTTIRSCHSTSNSANISRNSSRSDLLSPDANNPNIDVNNASSPSGLISPSSSTTGTTTPTNLNPDAHGTVSNHSGGAGITTNHEDDRWPHFPDTESLEDWLRNAFTDYLKSLLYNASGQGTRESFEDFGVEFLKKVQQKSYFKSWYYCTDMNAISNEPRSAFMLYKQISKQPATASLVLNLHPSPSKEIPIESDDIKTTDSLLESIDISEKSYKNKSTTDESNDVNNEDMGNETDGTIVSLYLHPGKLVQSRFGDYLPGYYQIRNYAEQSKALVSKGVTEIKKLGSDRGSQLKTQLSSGISKLSLFARSQGSKLATASSTWLTSGTVTAGPNPNQSCNPTVQSDNTKSPLQPILGNVKPIATQNEGKNEIGDLEKENEGKSV